jgi:hypothetical protein
MARSLAGQVTDLGPEGRLVRHESGPGAPAIRGRPLCLGCLNLNLRYEAAARYRAMFVLIWRRFKIRRFPGVSQARDVI